VNTAPVEGSVLRAEPAPRPVGQREERPLRQQPLAEAAGIADDYTITDVFAIML